MRELIERFSYRFQRWQRQRYGDHLGADPSAPRNPLRFIALVAVMSVILDATEPFVFHRTFDIVSIIRTPVALPFLILCQSKSPYAWHVVVAWLPLALFAYWVLRLAGYSGYQPRVHAPVSEFIAGSFMSRSQSRCFSGCSGFSSATCDISRMRVTRSCSHHQGSTSL